MRRYYHTVYHLCRGQANAGCPSMLLAPAQAICDADYRIVASCLKTPGSTDDREAWVSVQSYDLVAAIPGPVSHGG